MRSRVIPKIRSWMHFRISWLTRDTEDLRPKQLCFMLQTEDITLISAVSLTLNPTASWLQSLRPLTLQKLIQICQLSIAMQRYSTDYMKISMILKITDCLTEDSIMKVSRNLNLRFLRLWISQATL